MSKSKEQSYSINTTKNIPHYIPEQTIIQPQQQNPIPIQEPATPSTKPTNQ